MRWQNLLYYKFSEFLKAKYGSKVYKLPVNIPGTCPNRDGTLGTFGCIFCGDEGAGFENLPNQIGVKEQLQRNSQYIGQKYHSEKFIAYFQNYSNTYLPLEVFKQTILEACMDNICAIYISTRPDCIHDSYLSFLSHIQHEKKIDIVLEIGLQTVNYHHLKLLQRGHSLAEVIDATLRIRSFGLECCVHYIVDLPMDKVDDVIEGAKIISALGVKQVKCHSLYILKNTTLGNMYESGKIEPLSQTEYIERMILFLEYLNPEIVIQRLIGRAPEKRSLFCNWNTSWWKIRDVIEETMIREHRYQGNKFNYLNGQAGMGGLINPA
jgi:uncharacterized protein